MPFTLLCSFPFGSRSIDTVSAVPAAVVSGNPLYSAFHRSTSGAIGDAKRTENGPTATGRAARRGSLSTLMLPVMPANATDTSTRGRILRLW